MEVPNCYMKKKIPKENMELPFFTASIAGPRNMNIVVVVVVVLVMILLKIFDVFLIR